MNRRSLIKSLMMAPAVFLAFPLLQAMAKGKKVEMVSESDPTAKGLQYVCKGKDPKKVCGNCMLKVDGIGDGKTSIGCQIFPGKAVCFRGTCMSWAKHPTAKI